MEELFAEALMGTWHWLMHLLTCMPSVGAEVIHEKFLVK